MRSARLLVLALLLCAALPARAGATAPVTYRADALRTGWYRDQPGLAPGTVAGGTFGQLFSAPVAGQVYAQPLVSNGTLLVATEADRVYGLDPQTGAQRWERDLGTPFDPTEVDCSDLTPQVGVTGTPVIDPDTGTAYLAAKTGSGSATAYDMHALDLATGAERPGFPVRIQGHAGNAPQVAFNARMELQRPALLLMDGVVYAAFGGHCDQPPYQGWVAAVSTAGALQGLWTSATTSGGAGIWQAGGGLMSDGPGRIFLATGNGSAAPVGATPTGDLGESVVRLDAGSTMAARDFFAPYDADTLDGWDADFGSGGPVGLPSAAELPGSPFGSAAHPRLMVEVGKDGYIYLLDRDHLGGRAQGPGGGDAAVSRFGPGGGVWSSPAVWPGDGGWVYVPTASILTGGSVTSGSFEYFHLATDGSGTPTLDYVGETADAFGYGSSAPVVTSDGLTSGSALVWIVWCPSPGGDGQLRAYRPTVARGGQPQLVYSAPIGPAAKFNPPGVANGRVYVGTKDGHVLGFGAPVQPGLAGADMAFGATTVGSSSQRTATFTAQRPLTVTAVAASGPFSAGAPAPALPATLAAGDTLTVPVTFTPQSPGPSGGTLTATTSAGTFSLGLTGSGVLPNGHLTGQPTVLSFGGARTDEPITLNADFVNDGGAAITLQGVDAPSAPFSLGATPAAGTVLEPGDEVAIAVTYAPQVPGQDSDVITVHSSAGDAQVALTGRASTPPRLVLTPPADFGDVTVGGAADRRLVVANAGGSPLTIMKSKPPAGGAFTALDALSEGTVIAPGASRTLAIRFAPSAPGAAADAWQITGDDGSGPRVVALSGRGVAPPAPAPVVPGTTPPPVFTPAPAARPALHAVHLAAKRSGLTATFTLSRAGTVRLRLLRGKRVVARATIRARKGRNRFTLRHRLASGRYTVTLTPAGGRAVSRRLQLRAG
jgi:iron transport multicopper oxidase